MKFLKKLKFWKAFSFSWSFILLLIAIAVIFFGLRMAAEAYKNRKEDNQWNLKNAKTSYELEEFLNKK